MRNILTVKRKKNITFLRGPSPTGYHVPSTDEWVSLFKILIDAFGLANNRETLPTYLKIPLAGHRFGTSSTIGGAGTYALYRTSTPQGTERAYTLEADRWGLYPQDSAFRSDGFSIRSFKDEPAIPTSSWATLYDGSSIATGAGIFHNTVDGLISVSANGTNWITLMDKNLGATSTDTNSTNSYGYYYQWGNNYSFPITGSVTTSSTKVDTSNYGPGNYYSSSTFITVPSPYGDWSSIQNDNLRGYVSYINS